MKRRLVFGWYGGKFSHLDWLLPLLPQTEHYCEPFGGSAAVLLNKPPCPVETYNDIDQELVTFFKVLREQTDALIESIALTPFSREEFRRAIEEPRVGLSELERARRFYVRARQVRSGLAQQAIASKWAFCLLHSRSNMSGAISRWINGVGDLEGIADRLLRVQLECDDSLNVIARYDSSQTLFYCDPPYPHEVRRDKKVYANELSEHDHRRLADVLHSVKGKVAISSYSCSLMSELYADWERIEGPDQYSHAANNDRREILWVNYDLGVSTLPLFRSVDRKDP